MSPFSRLLPSADPGLKPHGLKHGAPQARRAVGDVDACRCKRLYFIVRRVIATGNYGAGMTHAATRRRCAARDEADDRLFGPAGLDEFGALDLGVAADFAD